MIKKTKILNLLTFLLVALAVGCFVVSDNLKKRQQTKDQIIIRVFLTYHRDVLGHNLNPDLIYEDGKKWVNDPQYNAVEYPK